MNTVITAEHAFTPAGIVRNARVVIEDGRISAVGSRDAVEIPAGSLEVDLGANILAPGFIDIHIHGGAGYDVMQASANELAAMERALATCGVTSYFPTTVTAPIDDTCVALERLAAAIETAEAREPGLRAQPLGVHLEGPFISHSKRGVHPPQYLLEPSVEIFDRLWQAARGNVSLMTLAPELPKAQYLIREATARGVCVSVGHSDATTEETIAGFAAGARHATHTFNAMRALDHREPGIIGAVLSDDRISAELICDGVHVSPEVVKLWYRAKGADRAVLVTDAISATGMGDGHYRLGGFEVEVKGACCEFEGKLAGSVLTLDQAVRNVMQFAKISLEDAVRLATLNPARVAGVSGRKGVLAAGADADIVVLSPRGVVVQTMVRGQGI